MIELRLYTTLGCHLCERLEALLATLCACEYRLERIEISEDDVLVERYGVRIPVLVDEAGDELDLGFEPARLADWLDARGRLDAAAWQRLQAGEPPRSPPARPESRGGRRYLG
ncbi:glutaredoxin family protein [Halomonas campisalis]|uniref:Glutaredoxin family protein n=1 Tax=Billgrantia campisalis TaxID=74661 RepID=A0ABS9P6H0_9GAMM|nr:glutaredoxin family protein [Halomonas campisalis]MCG6657354.1 glutaredoxin family protein [Halomonas campisalis]MDR5863301.1 glutaredoxin family protein [Halomonas campisalis]